MFNYVPSPTGMLLHNCDKYLKMIIGPYGSGKSCACVADVLTCACAQNPAPDGVRYVRVGVVRSSYPELIATTRKSLLELLPAEYGTIASSGSPVRGFYFIPLPDGTKVSLELELWALKTADDAPKLRSANWTFAWLNEATGCSPEVYNAVTGRIGRYPSQDLGGISWGGTIMDFNQPEPGSWLDEYIRNPQPNWAVFRQPPAAFKHVDEVTGAVTYEVNPNAENLRNLGAREEGDPDDFTSEQQGMRYYRNQIDALLKTGRTDIIDNQYCMMDVPIVDGKPVYSNFNINIHVAAEALEPRPFQPIIIGVDQSGIHPAAVILQNINGTWCVLDELYADNEGFENFLHGMLIPLLRGRYSTNPLVAAIDPSNTRDSWQAVTPKQRFADAGIKAVTELTNNPKVRIQTVEHMLNQRAGGLLIDPACRMLIRGFSHEYRYRKLRASGTMGSVYTPSPEKNDASHVHDALQYAALLIQRGDNMDKDTTMQNVRDELIRRRSSLSSVV